MRKVIVAVDGSDVSKSLMEYAFHYAAREKDVQLVFLHIIESSEYKELNVPGYAASVPPPEDEVKEHFGKLVAEARDVCGSDFSSYTVETRPGVAYEEIIDYATEHDVALIMIGHRRMPRLKRFFLGSVAANVVAHAHCSVYVHRPK